VAIPGLVLSTLNAVAIYVALYLTFEQSERALRGALAEVKTLSSLLPICMHCHKIRDDNGYWDRIDKYLVQHAGATFTHGICPTCLDKIYPDSEEKLE